MSSDPDARMAEIEAGLEGVRSGWRHEPKHPMFMGYRHAVYGTGVGDLIVGLEGDKVAERLAAHIARCDPDTIRSLIARIRAAEERAAKAEGELTVIRLALDRERLQFHADYEEMTERVAMAEAQLPEGMKHCTILFKECEKGHGWLTAANWVQHGCPTCAIEAERAACERIARHVAQCDGTARGAALTIADLISARK